MKNQIRSLNLVMFFLFIVLGLNAFTSPSQNDAAQEEIMNDLMEGKIQAAQALAAEEQQMLLQFEQAKKDFDQMNSRFDSYAVDSQLKNEESPSSLSGLSQLLYVYQSSLEAVNFNQLSYIQKKDLLAYLNSLKNDFNSAMRSVSHQKY